MTDAERVEPEFETIYNLFRRKLMPDLCCATPDESPVPSLQEGPAWEYASTLHWRDMPPPGFDLTDTELGVRLNGFHLFQITRTIVVRAPIEVRRPDALARSPTCRLRERIDQSHRRCSLRGSFFFRLWGRKID